MRVYIHFFLSGIFILSAQQYLILDSIRIDGNRKTQSYVIKRECPLHPGDSVQESGLEALAKQIRNNLMRTQLFVYDSVLIQKKVSSRFFSIHIHVKERWYVIPATYMAFLDRNINAWWLNRDWKRILIGCYLVLDNTTGNKDRLYIHAAYGYNRIIGVVYKFPYLNRKQTLGIRTEYTYSESGNMQYGIKDNKQRTYYSPNPYLLREIQTGASLIYRPGTQTEHKFNVYHKSLKGTDTLHLIQRDYFHRSEKNFRYLNLGYELSLDIRDNKFNPTEGFSLYYRGDVNSKFLKNSFLLTIHHISAQYHHAFHRRWIGSFMGAFRKMITENYPGYYFMKGLGYGTLTLRGYEYYIMDGADYYFLRSTLRYVILPVRYFKFPVKFIRQFNTIPLSVEFTLFADAGNSIPKFEQIPEGIFNKHNIPVGTGAGIQISSYYDFVVRLEYSITPYGKGFYLGFGSGF